MLLSAMTKGGATSQLSFSSWNQVRVFHCFSAKAWDFLGHRGGILRGGGDEREQQEGAEELVAGHNLMDTREAEVSCRMTGIRILISIVIVIVM